MADNGADVVTAYAKNGSPLNRVLTVPGGAPTGLIANQGWYWRGQNFELITATENGVIAVADLSSGATGFSAVVNNGNAVYKGLALYKDKLYVTNFRAGSVEVYDKNFTLISTLVDFDAPSGYAPFGIADIDGSLIITLAIQDEFKHDDVAGPGNGLVDYLCHGRLKRLISNGVLNSPWGITAKDGKLYIVHEEPTTW